MLRVSTTNQSPEVSTLVGCLWSSREAKVVFRRRETPWTTILLHPVKNNEALNHHLLAFMRSYVAETELNRETHAPAALRTSCTSPLWTRKHCQRIFCYYCTAACCAEITRNKICADAARYLFEEIHPNVHSWALWHLGTARSLYIV